MDKAVEQNMHVLHEELGTVKIADEDRKSVV